VCYFCNTKYQQRLYSKRYAPCTTFGRATLDYDSVANMLFVAFLYNYPDVGVHIFKFVGLSESSMVCCECVSHMSWCVNTNRNDVYRWRCRRKTSSSVSSASTSIRYVSSFRQRNLNLMDVLFLTNDIVCCIPA
jgi:hypothetical protein